jgi:hypothetical protein
MCDIFRLDTLRPRLASPPRDAEKDNGDESLLPLLPLLSKGLLENSTGE